MLIDQKLKYLDQDFTILAVEQEFIIHPVVFDILMCSKDSLQQPFSCSFQVNHYKLELTLLSLLGRENSDFILEKYHFNQESIAYNGAILIGDTPVKEYSFQEEKIACFSYKNVYELIFEDGSLITTIDLSRAMLRIRKNIELGLRSLSKKRDIRCISRFMNTSFVGDYRTFSSTGKRFRYLKEMKADYKNKTVSFLREN